MKEEKEEWSQEESECRLESSQEEGGEGDGGENESKRQKRGDTSDTDAINDQFSQKAKENFPHLIPAMICPISDYCFPDIHASL